MLQEAQEELGKCFGVSANQTSNSAHNIKAKPEMLWNLVGSGDGPLTEVNKEQLFFLLGEMLKYFPFQRKTLVGQLRYIIKLTLDTNQSVFTVMET